MILFIGYIAIAFSVGYKMRTTGYVDVGIISSRLIMNQIFLLIMYLYNLMLIIVNTVRIKKEKEVRYFPKIRFIRK